MKKLQRLNVVIHPGFNSPNRIVAVPVYAIVEYSSIPLLKIFVHKVIKKGQPRHARGWFVASEFTTGMRVSQPNIHYATKEEAIQSAVQRFNTAGIDFVLRCVSGWAVVNYGHQHISWLILDRTIQTVS
jgi:hypothetical protein